jgi:Rv0078B-related antitoxin
MGDHLSDNLSPEARELQSRIWRRKTPGEKIRMVDQLWRQARIFKRATLRSLHPDWTDGQIDEALWEAMSGRKRESL